MAISALGDRYILDRLLLSRNYGNVVSKGGCQRHNVHCFLRSSAVRQKATTRLHYLPMSSNNVFSDVQKRRFALFLHAS